MAKRKRETRWHVYNVQCDDEGSCAVTAFLSNTRVHVIADSEKLNPKSKLGAEYWDLFQAFNGQDNETPTYHNTGDTLVDKDSGVDVSADGTDSIEGKTTNEAIDPEHALLSWMLSPLLANQRENGQSNKASKSKSLHDWYRCSTEFYELAISRDDDNTLEAIELESTEELEKVVEDLVPSVALPKTVTDKLDVPHFLASDFQVLQCSDQPPGTPYHPCRVRNRQTKQTYFLKVVDNGQPRTTKRELDILGRITKLHLNKKMRIPVLEGLISFEDAQSTVSGRRKIMGFVQTEIPDPTPLTTLLDPSIPQAKRDRWAKEAERLKNILHQNDIIWGDAKADNFMVDGDDNLWIIDFGGSYTDGWVDPELKETEKGDDQGTNKTVNALQDPKACTYNPDENDTGKESQARRQDAGVKKKRKINDTDKTQSQPHYGNKRRRNSRLKK